MSALLLLSTFPDAEAARRIAGTLVEERLAACANLLPGAESIYRWEGKVERAAEVVAFFKTTEACRAHFEARLKELHPYEVPEILVLRPEGGLPAYLRWIEENVG
ncbi:MAG: divalent-cation tolerance protein CutA [Chthoniobacteraceae bacterium]